MMKAMLTTYKSTRWAAVMGVDAFLELCYIGLAAALVLPLQMGIGTKCAVISAFLFRLPCIVFSALHVASINRYVDAPDHGTSIAQPIMWQQIALGYGIIAATIPTLKNFVRGYNKAIGRDASYKKRGLGGGFGLDSYGMGGSGAGNSMQLRSVPRKGSALLASHDPDATELRPAGGQYRVGAYRDGKRPKDVRRTSTGSNESEDPIIRRDISIRVEYEGVQAPG
jgi:hypothetical protein